MRWVSGTHSTYSVTRTLTETSERQSSGLCASQAAPYYPVHVPTVKQHYYQARVTCTCSNQRVRKLHMLLTTSIKGVKRSLLASECVSLTRCLKRYC